MSRTITSNRADCRHQSFSEFERAGWEDPTIVARYDEHLSVVTTQSIDALLDDAGVRVGSRLLDVATGAGYVAGAALQRGATPLGIDFSAAQIRLARTRYPPRSLNRRMPSRCLSNRPVSTRWSAPSVYVISRGRT
ncbi:MAG: class I SAM-dependent methyltransferase [Pseudomonadota bacterium]|nr:class I SAM-dependent methyltransferase [Pseudomonadota bacterium]